MSKIQDRLNKLQPYIGGIRYTEGIAIVDANFKDGWYVPESNAIVKHIDEEDKNHYYFVSQKDDIGVDEIFDFIQQIITLNIERELKSVLLKEKIEELKAIFNKKSLAELKTIKFTVYTKPEEDMVSINDIKPNIPKEEPINDTEEDEIYDEDYGKVPETVEPIIEKPSERQVRKNSVKHSIELPPKGKIELEVHELPESATKGPCNCGPDEYCSKCMDEKGY
jgi:hypothetical protein